MQRRLAIPGLVAVLALTLAGCVDAPEAGETPTPGETINVTAPPVPEIDLDGTASGNKDYFDAVNTELIQAGGSLDGRAFIDNLVSAGYPKSDMEVTSDTTPNGNAADNIQFSVRLNGTCLIGQYGNVGYGSTTSALLSTGRCLVGQTRPIDW